MDLSHRRIVLLALAKVALPAVEELPPMERADALEGLAIAMGDDNPDVAKAALNAASHLRVATENQLTLRLALQ